MRELIIDLNNLENNLPLDTKELIYNKDFESLMEDIRRKVQANVAASNGNDECLVWQPCFFINGGRGSGKSTFLRSLRNSLCEFGQGSPKISLLAKVDPTELADSEMFFIHILGMVHSKLKDAFDPHDKKNYEARELYRSAYSCIQKMSKGLGTLVPNPASLTGVTDACYLIQESVEACESGVKLKKLFASLISRLCQLLKVDAMLVTIDDADMNFNKCQEVFETVRKYLLNPRMVFVFAGDLKLYAMVIRAMQLNHFGELALQHDDSRKNHRIALMDVLEDQYVLKLFPIENRVELGDFSRVLDAEPLIKYQKSEKEVRETSIDNFLSELLSHKMKLKDIGIWKDYIERLSIRSALQLLAFWTKCLHVDDDSCKDAWREGVCRVAVHSLLKHQIDFRSIKSGNVEALTKAIYTHVSKLSKKGSSASLLAGTGDESMQMATFYLATEATCRIRSIRDVFVYILNVFPRLQCPERASVHIDQSYTQNVHQFGAACTAIMLPSIDVINKREKIFANGVVPLLSWSQGISDEPCYRMSVQDFAEALKKELADKKDVKTIKSIIAIAAAFSRIVENGTSVYSLSVYNILSKLVALFAVLEQEKEDEGQMFRRVLLFNANMIPTSVLDPKLPSHGIHENVLGVAMKEWFDFEILFEEEYERMVDEVVVELKEWMLKVKDLRVSIHPSTLQVAWNHFYQECLVTTNECKIKAIDEKSLVQAGALFASYVRNFIVSMFHVMTVDGERLISCLSSCPLLQIWTKKEELAPGVKQKLDMVNVGHVELTLNKERAEEIIRYRLSESYSRYSIEFKSAMDAEAREFETENFEPWWNNILQWVRRTYSDCWQEIKPDSVRGKLEKRLKLYEDKLRVEVHAYKREFNQTLQARKNNLVNSILRKLQEEEERALASIMSIAESVTDENELENKVIKKKINELERSKNRAIFTYRRQLYREMMQEVSSFDKDYESKLYDDVINHIKKSR